MENEIKEKFGGHLRLRACGVLIENEEILLIKHRGLGAHGHLWIPPGGGVEFGSSITHNLKREFLEETGLEVEVGELLFVFEFYDNPLHAIELFFKVGSTGGTLGKGIDPELDKENQIIEEVRFVNAQEFQQINDKHRHSVFVNVRHPSEILNMKGYFQNWK